MCISAPIYDQKYPAEQFGSLMDGRDILQNNSVFLKVGEISCRTVCLSYDWTRYPAKQFGPLISGRDILKNSSGLL